MIWTPVVERKTDRQRYTDVDTDRQTYRQRGTDFWLSVWRRKNKSMLTQSGLSTAESG